MTSSSMRGGSRFSRGGVSSDHRTDAERTRSIRVDCAVTAALAVLTGHAWGALWILLPGVVVHLYPVLLQRSIMLRLQPLLDKSGS
jgi:hypothetical protein